MKLFGKIPLIIYIVCLLIMGSLVWYFWGERLTLSISQNNLFDLSLDVDAVIKDELVAWGIEDSDIINEYRKEMRSGGQIWVLVNRDIAVSAGRLPAGYAEKLTEVVHAAGCNVYRSTIQGNRFIFEAGQNKQILHRLIFTFLREKKPDIVYAAIVISGVGFDKDLIDQFLELGIPLTFAVIPQEQHAQSISEYIHRHGGEIIVSMPMEPKEYPKINPGPNALLCSMENEKIQEKFFDNLYSLPFAVGISNYMGSSFLEDEEKVEVLLSSVQQSGLFYVDTRTVSNSFIPDLSKKLNLSLLVIDVFLDDEDDMRYIKQQLQVLANRSKQMNTAVGIGRVDKKYTALAIKKSLQYFKYQGIEFVTLSELLHLPH
ncbi:MAG: divergent polysaccharide deacetylase family protein [bacterium]